MGLTTVFQGPSQDLPKELRKELLNEIDQKTQEVQPPSVAFDTPEQGSKRLKNSKAKALSAGANVTCYEPQLFGETYPLINGINWPEFWREPRRILVPLAAIVILLPINLWLVSVVIFTSCVRRVLQFLGVLKKKEVKVAMLKDPVNVADSHVCIIGGGASGLVTAKECLEQGLRITCYEESDGVGGLYGQAQGYDSGLMTTSNFLVNYSSFLLTEHDLPVRMWRFNEFVEYTRRFAEKYRLVRHIQFSTAVVSVEELEDGTWKVTTKKKDSETTESVKFTHLVVASGGNKLPNIPTFPGQEHFKGRIMHAGAYKNGEEMKGKRVLMVGMGESASDIALQISQNATSLMQICRSGPGAVVPRYHGKMPNDIGTTRSYHCLPRKMWSAPGVAMNKDTTPTWHKWKTWIEDMFNTADDDALDEAMSEHPMTKYFWMNRYGTKTTSFVVAWKNHGAGYKETEIKEIHENGVVFTNGESYECDTILLCTGYKAVLPFMPPSIQVLNFRNDMFKKLVHPKYGTRLFYVGFARPSLGTIPTVSEMSARYTSLLISGRLDLPSDEEMQRTMKEDREFEEWNFPLDYKRLSGLTDYMTHMTNMSKLIGCQIPWIRLLMTDPLLAHRCFYGQFSSAAYRLQGAGADYKTAREHMFIPGTAPISAQCAKTCLVLISCLAHNFGLSDAPIGFDLW